MIDNHHLAYVGVLTVFVIGATVVALVWTLVLATAFAVAGFVRIRKRRKPIAATKRQRGRAGRLLGS